MKLRGAIGLVALVGCTEFPSIPRDAGGRDVSTVVDAADVPDVSMAVDAADVPGTADVPMPVDITSDTVVFDVKVADDVADVPGTSDAPEVIDAPMDAGASDVPADVAAADHAPPTDRVLPPADDGTVACPSGQVACGSGCRNLLTDALNCGACGAACALPNASSSTCAGGACRVGACAAGFADCDRSPANGCEVDTQTSAGNCGGCGRVCAVPNATPECSASACRVSVCASGFRDCDGSPSNGCEAFTQTSTIHCGACGHACSTGQTCALGICVTLPPTCPSGMRLIPEGQFLMGDPNPDDTPSQPVHGVRVSAFCVDETEVTVAAYATCPSGTCSRPGTVANCNWGVSGRDQHPVTCVDWSQSRAYCQWRGGDLPTEAQWEFAARGTEARTFPWGESAPGSQLCWSGGEPGRRTSSCAVRSFLSGATPSGLFDMEGSVWEWTLDWFGPYQGNASTYAPDPVGPSSGDRRVLRGGAWYVEAPILVRAAFRDPVPPTQSDPSSGFRCASTATMCAAGFGNCDGLASNGCEINTQASTTHCGVCGHACETGQTCTSGSCVTATPVCAPGMRLIPGGTFLMGDAMADDPMSQPVHGVRLSPFCMDETEVTVAAYAACVDARACPAPATTPDCTWNVAGHDQHPVNCVDWSQSRAYCQWRGGDLPTEAQWEFGARGTDGRTYPWGNEVPGTRICWSNTVSTARTCEVRTFPMGNSPFALSDMAGNVKEWTLDREGPYSGDASMFVLDPTGPGPGGSENRVHRGGSWGSASTLNYRATYRDRNAPTNRSNDVGFRCARGPR